MFYIYGYELQIALEQFLLYKCFQVSISPLIVSIAMYSVTFPAVKSFTTIHVTIHQKALKEKGKRWMQMCSSSASYNATLHTKIIRFNHT